MIDGELGHHPAARGLVVRTTGSPLFVVSQGPRSPAEQFPATRPVTSAPVDLAKTAKEVLTTARTGSRRAPVGVGRCPWARSCKSTPTPSKLAPPGVVATWGATATAARSAWPSGSTHPGTGRGGPDEPTGCSRHSPSSSIGGMTGMSRDGRRRRVVRRCRSGSRSVRECEEDPSWAGAAAAANPTTRSPRSSCSCAPSVRPGEARRPLVRREVDRV